MRGASHEFFCTRLTCRQLLAYSLARGDVCMNDTDAVFKALADPSRRQLLDALNQRNGQTLGQLCEHLDMTRQAVTQHLGLLESANLVATAWRGREKLHFLNPVPLQQIYDRWIRKFERSRIRAINELKRRLEGTNNE
jgi:DNA-binding transcriptional ArsR family regulator